MKPCMIALGLMLACGQASAATTASKPIPFDTHTGYFVSNKFEPKAGASFVAIRDQQAFDNVFGVAFVMGDKSHRLPTNAFDTKMVLAIIKRGKATWDYAVKSVRVEEAVLTFDYTATAKQQESAEFACPLIVSVPKGDYAAIEFLENGKSVKRIEAVGKAPSSRPATGDQLRRIEVGGRNRSYLVHLPPKHDPKKPAPVVLIFHGAATNASMMAAFCGMNKKADEAGFVAVYPNGTGLGELLLTFNAWDSLAKNKADDVAFTAKLLDDLARTIAVDPNRVYATGMSNGGMMCYRLAAELSDRIAAIAPVAGTLAIEKCEPNRPVPVMHFHGTADTIVPFKGPNQQTPRFLKFKSVEDTVQTWVKLNGCPEKPRTADLPDVAKDGTTVLRKTYGPGKDGAEVVLYVIEGGGHTWPGQEPVVGFIGKSTRNVNANDLIWEFFEKHPMPAAASQPASSPKAEGASAFEVACRKPEDRVEATVEGGKAIFSMTCPSGIGGATIERKGDEWPKAVVLRLHLRGLESLSITCGDIKLSVSVLSHSGNARSLHLWKDGKEGPQLTKDSPCWMEVKTFDPTGKPITGLPDKGGYFEVTVPKALLNSGRAMKVEWVDFWR